MEPSPRPSLLWRLFVLLGVGGAAAVTFSDDAADIWEDATGGAVPRETVRAVFFGTLGLHAVEALIVSIKATRAGVGHPLRWGMRTLLWGFPVMRRLKKTIKFHKTAELDAA